MKLPLYQVDAFASRLFTGNPAAVVPLREWLEDAAMQAIAMENNLSETAFFVPHGEGYHIRWFTPAAEVDLCGHATLATAFIVFTVIEPRRNEVVFESRSGLLSVSRDGDLLVLDFPSQPPAPCAVPRELAQGLGREPDEVLCAEDYFVVFGDEAAVRRMEPDMAELKKLGLRGIIVTAPGDEVDFVSRFFVPSHGIDEDPVTGSAHCALTPYWALRLRKSKLHAWQLSHRGGELFCEDRGERVLISGRAVPYLEGFIVI
ncbi:MAG: PhzF family phenazine biosynthesis protein [Actinobacteria bacterium]|nr:PhzF family phenazine biosynthesis protein [Actinomycetota bacterium]